MEQDAMQRRMFLLGTGASLACPSIAMAETARTLKMVPYANLSSIDPMANSGYTARNHGFMVYDTLYAWNDRLEPEPQMAAGDLVEDDGRQVTITLRPGLRFHDGEPVRAIDAVVSLRRWMKRNPYGQRLEALTDELSALDDTRLRFRLKKPFPLLTTGLGAIDWPCVVMPERIARTDPLKAIDDATGSGPFRFKKDEYNSGSLVVYERNPAYVPRASGETRLTAGPKIVHFDRIELHVLPDASTAAAALQAGEVDWYEQVPPDMLGLLGRSKALKVQPIGPHDVYGVFRLNHLQSPFDNKAIRQALLPAIVQADFMQAVMGVDPEGWRGDVGIFPAESTMASTAGLGPLRGPRSLDVAREKLRQAGYSGQKVRLLAPSEVPEITQFAQVGADLFTRLGFDLDYVQADTGTVVQRRNSREPVERGGWSILSSAPAAFGLMDPALHQFVRGNGEAGLYGWPRVPRLEELRNAWFDAPDLAARKAIAAEIQTVAVDEVTYLPLGSHRSYTALRRDLTDRVPGLPIFWNIRRT
jgi:ABC-type transport system substrate-binding protein